MLVFFQIFLITARSSSLACSRFPEFKKQEGGTSLVSFAQQCLSVLTGAAGGPTHLSTFQDKVKHGGRGEGLREAGPASGASTDVLISHTAPSPGQGGVPSLPRL